MGGFSRSNFMSKYSKVILILTVILLAAFIFWQKKYNVKQQTEETQSIILPDQGKKQAASNEDTKNVQQAAQPKLQAPLDQAAGRITKKPFGIFITPKTSPVQPERFQGFHAGADFETFPAEADSDVVVYAVCEGKLLEKRTASGYGGVVVQACQLEGKPITVVYGHLKSESVTSKIGENLKSGDKLGILGKGYSQETDGERKHLHLGFHKGSKVSILGYVQSKNLLDSWIDPCKYVCTN
jgi:hypothetical protein